MFNSNTIKIGGNKTKIRTFSQTIDKLLYKKKKKTTKELFQVTNWEFVAVNYFEVVSVKRKHGRTVYPSCKADSPGEHSARDLFVAVCVYFLLDVCEK